MDEEQSGNRNSAGPDPVVRRTPQNLRGKTYGVAEDKGKILRQIMRGS
jgi:hypothetical protein